MAVLEDPNTGSMAAVDASKSALRASLRPFELTGYSAFGAQSGALTGVAANGPVFSLRNAAGNGDSKMFGFTRRSPPVPDMNSSRGPDPARSQCMVTRDVRIWAMPQCTPGTMRAWTNRNAADGPPATR